MNDDVYETEITLEELMDYIVETWNFQIWIERNIHKSFQKVPAERGYARHGISQDLLRRRQL